MISRAQICKQNGLVYVPTTGRCETPYLANRLASVAKRHGVGFIAIGGEDQSADDEYFYWFDPEDYAYGGGGDSFNDYSFLPVVTTNYPTPLPDAGPSAGNPFELVAEWLSNLISGNYDTGYGSAPSPVSTGNNSTGIIPSIDYGQVVSTGSVVSDSEIAQTLPGYCPQGTYHPLDNPLSCVSFPADDATKKRQAATQRQGQQQQARAQRKTQQQASATCPKDPLGRAVWRNPKTGKCELVPICPAGSSFDQVTGRCLTATQASALYGQSNLSWLWWVVGGILVVLVVRSSSNRSDYQPARRRRVK